MTTRVVYEIGSAREGWELDPVKVELRRSGVPVPLRPKPFAVLQHLVLHRDRFVAKEELLDALWPGVTVSETALTTAVKVIRRALGDDSGQPRFIETKRGRGYRWVAEVRERADAPSAGATSDTFVGREDALATLSSALDAALTGRCSVVLVRGEAGIGKTRLLAELAARVDARRIPRATAWCAEESAAPPFWPWMQLLRRLDEAQRVPPQAGSREAVRPLLGGAEPAGGDDGLDFGEQRQERQRLFDGVGRLLRAVAARDGLVLVLDDAHAADAASLRLLAFVARESHDARILLVAALREPSALGGSLLTETKGALARLPHCRTLELSSLPAPAAHGLARAFAGDDVSEDVLGRVLERSNGNPFYLRELAAAAARDPSALPAAIRDALCARLARLPDACQEALAVGAVIGEEFAADLVGRVVGASADEIGAVLEPASRDGLLRETRGGHRFQHALVAETIRAEQGRARLMGLHLRVGEALERDAASADPDRLARHFSAALESGAARAAEYSRQAGQRAMRVRAFENAAGHYERALRALELEASTDLARRGELLTRLGEARRNAGEPIERVAQALDEAIELARRRADGDALARALLGYLTLTVRRTDLLELHDEALRLRAATEDATTVALLSRLAMEHHFRERPERAKSLVARALAIAERLGTPAPLGQALTAWLIVAEGREAAGARLVAAERVIAESECAARPALAAIARWKLFFVRIELGEPDAAREMEAFARSLDGPGNARQRPNLLRQRAALAFLAGDLDGAMGHLVEARELAERASNPAALWFAVLSTCLCIRERGDGESVVNAFLTLRERVPRNRHSRYGLVDAYARMGRIDEARAELGTLDEDESERAPHLSRPLVAAWLAEASRVLRDPGLIERLSRWIEPSLGTHLVSGEGSLWLGAGARYAGLLAFAAGRLDAAVEHLERALGENESAGAVLWSEHCRCDLAHVMLSRGGAGDRANALALLDASEGWAASRPVGALQQDLRAARLAAEHVIPLRGRRA